MLVLSTQEAGGRRSCSGALSARSGYCLAGLQHEHADEVGRGLQTERGTPAGGKEQHC